MTQHYFLGANSKAGFSSLYEGFPWDPDSYLHVIKGGPGTGKSSFMRKLGAEAEKREMDVQYVLCSGDPDSLDGVYIPALHTAWVDGTAPHVCEPSIFGVNGDYLNLGAYCTKPFSGEDHAYLGMLTRQYKEHYRLAYAALGSLGHLQEEGSAPLSDGETAAARQQIGRILDRFLPRESRQEGRSVRRFLHAISCQGELWLTDEIKAAGRQICVIRGDLPEAAGILAYAAGEARRRGAFCVCCPSPLAPALLEAVLLPEEGLAFAAGNWKLDAHLLLDLDSFRSAEGRQDAMTRRVKREELSAPLLSAALEELRRAKALHDQLEGVYKPHMDFEALSSFTQKLLDRLFS